jgi:transposase
MKSFILTENELKRLKAFMKACDKDEYKRALAIIHRSRGIPYSHIASMLGVHIRSIQRWISQYRQMGIEGLKTKPHPGKKPRIGKKEKRLIEKIALKSPKAFGYLKNDWSIRFLATHLSKELGIKVSKSHLHRILHELGLAYKRPKAYVKSPDPDYEAKKKALEGYKKISKALLKKR